MALLTCDEIERLRQAITTQDHLQRILTEIERLQRLVFHSTDRTHWDRLRTSAEQILMAELVSRHEGDPVGLFLVLRAHEDAGQTWEVAIASVAGQIHSYFTTPLGIVLRRNLFGDAAAYLAPDAIRWLAGYTREQRAPR